MSQIVSHSLDIRAVRERIRWYAERLAKRSDVLAVVLFGSLVAEGYTAGSDADVMVVLRSSDRPFPERLAEYATAELGVPADIFVYTAQEVAQMIAENRGIPPVAVREGEVLFLREGWQLPGEAARGPDSPSA